MAATTAVVATAAISAGAAGYSAYSQNKAQKAQLDAIRSGGGGDFDPAEAYAEAIKTDFKYAPKQAQQEWELKQKYLPRNAKLAHTLYDRWAGKFASSNLDALRGVDPESIDARKQMYSMVSEDAKHGTKLSDDEAAQVAQYVRAAQASRGNALGNANETTEALTMGERGRALYQQRVNNLDAFLRAPAPEDRFASLAGNAAPAFGTATTAAASPGYQFIDRGAGGRGVSTGMALYGQEISQGNLRASVLGQPQTSPWMAALAGGGGAAVSTYTQLLKAGAFDGQGQGG